MHGSPFVGWLLVLLCGAAGVYCLSRVRTGPVAQRVEVRGEGMMASGMALMALPASAVAPPSWSPWLFVAAFGAMGLWALVCRHIHHAVGALAMVYMALVMVLPPVGGERAGGVVQPHHLGHTGPMGHATPGGVPLLTGLLLAYYTVFILAAGVRLAPAAVVADGSAVDGPEVDGRPAVVAACRVAMGIAMLAMLLTV
ncbi:DUF5134 domain-containing protein [Streptomyces chattanoogensis]|uniref:DUF5134 domain-containing protein n=1 Tax=Streptomyces chattanoogensis TaxID=66876 RepID=UPI0036C3F579